MVSIREKFSVIKTIFSQPKNIILATTFAALMYLLNAMIVQWANLHLIKVLGISLFLEGFYYAVGKPLFYGSVVVSLLTGILLSMLVYRSRLNAQKKENLSLISSIAVFLGLLAPGCVSCGIGLAAAIGIGASLATLPFHGLEVSAVATILLIYSINRTAVSFIECIVPKKKWKINGKRN